MKSIRITGRNNSYEIEPLTLPIIHRVGIADPSGYRRQAQGQAPRADFNPNRADGLRTISLNDGAFKGLGGRPGAELTFVVSGNIRLTTADSKTCELERGDILFTDDAASNSVTLDSRNGGKLLQITVAAEWPGPDGELPPTDVADPPRGAEPNIKRIYRGKGDDDKAYYTEFPELFSAPAGQWSEGRAIDGFRMLYWIKGEMDMHPCVVNQFSVTSAGQLEIEVSGTGEIQRFGAGEICLSIDTTGEGHANRVHVAAFTTVFVIPQDQLWKFNG